MLASIVAPKAAYKIDSLSKSCSLARAASSLGYLLSISS